MSGKNVKFGNKEINKSNFYKNEKLFKMEDIDTNNILVSKKMVWHKKININTLLDIMMMMM